MTEKKKFTLSGERIVIMGLIVALTFTLAGFAVASAANPKMPAGNGLVRFCRNLSGGGAARIVELDTACAAGEQKVQMKTSDPIGVEFDGEGGFDLMTHNLGQHVTSVSHPAVGQYVVNVNKNVSNCLSTVSPAGFNNHYAVTSTGVDANSVRVFTYNLDNTQTAADTGFAIAITC